MPRFRHRYSSQEGPTLFLDDSLTTNSGLGLAQIIPFVTGKSQLVRTLLCAVEVLQRKGRDLPWWVKRLTPNPQLPSLLSQKTPALLPPKYRCEGKMRPCIRAFQTRKSVYLLYRGYMTIRYNTNLSNSATVTTCREPLHTKHCQNNA